MSERQANVLQALKAVEKGDLAALDNLFSEDVVYRDPRMTLRGLAAMKAQFGEDRIAVSDMVWQTRAIAEGVDVVMTERSDTFTLNGARVTHDIVGVFEFGRDGKIAAWREYFDLSQLPEH